MSKRVSVNLWFDRTVTGGWSGKFLQVSILSPILEFFNRRTAMTIPQQLELMASFYFFPLVSKSTNSPVYAETVLAELHDIVMSTFYMCTLNVA